jgi:hypothetical protein
LLRSGSVDCAETLRALSLLLANDALSDYAVLDTRYVYHYVPVYSSRSSVVRWRERRVYDILPSKETNYSTSDERDYTLHKHWGE